MGSLSSDLTSTLMGTGGLLRSACMSRNMDTRTHMCIYKLVAGPLLVSPQLNPVCVIFGQRANLSDSQISQLEGGEAISAMSSSTPGKSGTVQVEVLFRVMGKAGFHTGPHPPPS